MLKYIMLSAGLISMFTTVQSKASNLYGELDALYFASPGDFDGEQTMGLTLGWEINNHHSVEAEIQVNGLDSQKFGFEADADLISYLLGYRFTFAENGNVRYFSGLGVGYSRAEFSTDSTTREKQGVNMGFIRAGVEYDFSPNAYVTGELRYQHISDLSKNGVEYEIGDIPVVGVSFGYRF